MTAPLSDVALAELLAKAEAESARDPDDSAPYYAYCKAADSATVSALAREVQRLRVSSRLRKVDEARELAERLKVVTHENNALRKNNERLTMENTSMAAELRASRTAHAVSQRETGWLRDAKDAALKELATALREAAALRRRVGE